MNSDVLRAFPSGLLCTSSLCSLAGDIQSGLQSFATGVWPAANLAIYVPFTLDYEITVVRMAVYNFATVNGNFDLGIFDRYGNVIVHKASTAMSGASALQFLDITDTTLVPSNYFMGLCSTSSTATYGRFTGGSALLLEAAGVQQEDRTSLTPPAFGSAATFANPANNYVPWIGLDLKGTL